MHVDIEELTFELRRPKPSPNCPPERFSRNVAWRANPESLLDTGVVGNVLDIGDGATGDGGDCEDELLLPPVELVDGRSLLRLVDARDCKKAL